jgi:hypothetical protein
MPQLNAALDKGKQFAVGMDVDPTAQVHPASVLLQPLKPPQSADAWPMLRPPST